MKNEYEYQQKMFGTNVSISIVSNNITCANEYAQDVFQRLKEYEQRFTRFDSMSELSLLNEKKELVVSKMFIEVITLAKKLYEETDGVFNPLVSISRLGYNKSFEKLSETLIAQVQDDEYNINFDTVEIDTEKQKVKLQVGQTLDFGGFLKGFLAEKTARYIFEHTDISGVIVNIGGDLYTLGTDAQDKTFCFEVYNPVLGTEIKIDVVDSALATSGTYKRTWKVADVHTHHILDKSGKQNPQTEFVSASVISKSGARADAFAKVLLSQGPSAQNKLLDCRGYILIDKTGKVY